MRAGAPRRDRHDVAAADATAACCPPRTGRRARSPRQAAAHRAPRTGDAPGSRAQVDVPGRRARHRASRADAGKQRLPLSRPWIPGRVAADVPLHPFGGGEHLSSSRSLTSRRRPEWCDGESRHGTTLISMATRVNVSPGQSAARPDRACRRRRRTGAGAFRSLARRC